MHFKRRGCYVAALDPVMGLEISKTRPIVVVSNDQNNKFSGKVTILPITTQNLKKIILSKFFYPKVPQIYPSI
jgi:mRNA interferase MazF